jgi:hypothetical protein
VQVHASAKLVPSKAEQFIQTLLREWAYGVVYRTSTQRPERSHPGSATTTNDDPTAPSVTNQPSRDSPRLTSCPGTTARVLDRESYPWPLAPCPDWP